MNSEERAMIMDDMYRENNRTSQRMKMLNDHNNFALRKKRWSSRMSIQEQESLLGSIVARQSESGSMVQQIETKE
jgi:hypothetical protein